MTITGGSSLPKEDIDRMVREAAEHEAEDKARREAAEQRNVAESTAYQVEKVIGENDDKLPADVKNAVQADLDELKTALAGEDDDAVKAALDKLNSSQQQLGEALYAAQQEQAPEAPTEGGAQPEDDDIVDAEVVDDEDENEKK